VILGNDLPRVRQFVHPFQFTMGNAVKPQPIAGQFIQGWQSKISPGTQLDDPAPQRDSPIGGLPLLFLVFEGGFDDLLDVEILRIDHLMSPLRCADQMPERASNGFIPLWSCQRDRL
jgi:hypothetical protein